MGVSSALFPTVQLCALGRILSAIGGRRLRFPRPRSASVFDRFRGSLSTPAENSPLSGTPALVHRATCLAVDWGQHLGVFQD